MYVRSKRIKGYIYYYLVEGRRDGAKVRQKVVRYLGKHPLLLTGGTASSGVTPDTSPPIYTGFADIATPVLEQLTGRQTVSKQFIADLARSPTIRQAERDIITATLAEMPEGKISVQEFADKVHAHLLPLKGVPLGEGVRPAGGLRYEGISLDEDIRGDVSNYIERIYESSVETSAGNIHFADLGTTNYFAHTRIEDMADTKTRRVIEVQSDLFQRGRLELEKSRFEPELIDYSNGERVVTPAHRVDRTVEISKLVPYEDTWYERIIHEEVKKAAEDGKTRLQFPTGETAMKIEGLGQEAGGGMMFALRGFPIEPQDLKVGLEIYSEAQDADWIITDILADGKFNAVPKYMLGVHSLEDTIKALDSSGLENFERRKETFDISGTIDMSNPIYRFYEHRVQRCLKRYRPAMQRVTDRQRVTWFQIPLYPADATRPVSAFGVARPSHTSNSNTRVRHNT